MNKNRVSNGYKSQPWWIYSEKHWHQLFVVTDLSASLIVAGHVTKNPNTNLLHAVCHRNSL